jgi:hypothetical protein
VAASTAPVQAIPMALVASLYPLGLAVVFLLARAPRSRARVGMFVIGATVCTLAVGFAVVFVLHGAGFGDSGQQSSRYGLRLTIGVLLLTGAAVVARRPPKPRSNESRVTKAARDGGLIAVLLAGMALYLPSPVYLSALQVIGTTKLDAAALTVWIVLVVALVLITIEVPALLIILAPGWTAPRLQVMDAWLSRNSHTLLVAVLAVLGVWETVDGLVGLL